MNLKWGIVDNYVDKCPLLWISPDFVDPRPIYETGAIRQIPKIQKQNVYRRISAQFRR